MINNNLSTIVGSLLSMEKMEKKGGKENIKRVMVFGVFDRLHPGHLDFLRQAREHGDELIAVVARDAMVMELKNRMPVHSEGERMRMVGKVPEVTLAVLGDEVTGSYGVIVAHQPDVICVGYDQQGLADDLQRWIRDGGLSMIKLIILIGYKADTFHTKLLTSR